MLKRCLAAAAAFTLAAACLAAAPSPADARERGARASVQTQRGAVQGESRVQRQRGQRDRSAVWTGPNGGQRSVDDQRRWNRQEGTYNHDRLTTYPDGSSRAVDVDAERTAPGEHVVQRQVTGRNGETRTQSGVFETERTDTGRVTQGDITTSNAGQVDYSREVSRQDGVRTVTSSATFEDGTSVSRSSAGSCSGASCSSTTALTGRGGQTTVVEQARARTETGSVYSRDTTFADGTARSVDRERVGNGDGTGVVNRTVTGRNGETRTQTGAYEVTSEP